MNLNPALTRAGKALLGMLDQRKSYLPVGGYEVAHDLGRFWDAVLRLESVADFQIPAEIESASLRNLHLLTDNPAHLLTNRLDLPETAAKAKINPHNIRETLLAYAGLIGRRQSRWAVESALHLVAALDTAFGPDGHLRLAGLGDFGRLQATADPSHTEVERHGWFDATATSGRAIEGLVEVAEAAAAYGSVGHSSVGGGLCSRALALANRIAAHHLRMTLSPDGAPRRELFDAENAGHDHSYLGTLRGLLRYGIATRQKRFVDAVERTYRRTVSGTVVHESGWAPHDLGRTRFPNEHGDPVGDPASAGDAAQLALRLAIYAGCQDLLDDVERIVRSRLVPAQLTDADPSPGGDDGGEWDRRIGGWAIHGPTHGGKGLTPDVAAAVTHSLCDVLAHSVTAGRLGVWVHLHVDRDDGVATVKARREDGRAWVAVRPIERRDIFVRVPAWAPANSVVLRVDGRARAVSMVGAYAHVPADAGPEGSVELSFGLPERESSETMPSGRRYRFLWSGDEIVGAKPADGPLPFYPPIAGPTAPKTRSNGENE